MASFKSTAGASSSKAAPTKARTSPSNFPPPSRARCKPRAIKPSAISTHSCDSLADAGCKLVTFSSMAKKGSILVVDDEEVIRDVLDSLLVAEGYEVELASNGEEGLDKVQQH